MTGGPTVSLGANVIPLCITTCCREWISPYGFRGGSCGLCGERPTFTRLLPESEWLTPAAPRTGE